MKNNILLLKNRIKRFLRLTEKVDFTFCNLCGAYKNFFIRKGYTLRREAVCESCRICLRSNSLISVLKNEIKDKKDISIYNTSSEGGVHKFLKNEYKSNKITGKYFFSDYRDGNNLGVKINGVRNENLEKLTFQDASMDVIITEEVLEHVDDYKKALKEIHRVLRRGGVHIFTIPFHENNNTINRLTNDKHVVIHGDYLRKSIPVVTDFGLDIFNIIENETGMKTNMIKFHDFYKKEELTSIKTEDDYNNYLKFINNIGRYFKYNNIVFISRKDKKIII